MAQDIDPNLTGLRQVGVTVVELDNIDIFCGIDWD
jgi:hypothetical protein